VLLSNSENITFSQLSEGYGYQFAQHRKDNECLYFIVLFEQIIIVLFHQTKSGIVNFKLVKDNVYTITYIKMNRKTCGIQIRKANYFLPICIFEQDFFEMRKTWEMPSFL